MFHPTLAAEPSAAALAPIDIDLGDAAPVAPPKTILRMARHRRAVEGPDANAVLLGRLLSAPREPYGLLVETKSEDRVVGTWAIELNPHDSTGINVSQVKATLHACATSRAERRSSGAFLVVNQWWLNLSDSPQVDKLYAALCRGVLERFDSLMGGRPGRADDGAPPYVLYLIDGRRRERKRRALSLARLEAEFLQAMENGHGVPGLDLLIAHGHGTGTAAAAQTAPAALAAAASEAEASSAQLRKVGPGEVFIRETLSTENLRWVRKPIVGPAPMRDARADPGSSEAVVAALGAVPGPPQRKTPTG